MTSLKSSLLALLSLISAAILPAAEASRAARWSSAEFSAVVSGTSTLHDWQVASNRASGEIDLTNPAALTGKLTVVATSLDHESDGLKSRMYTALKADAYDKIVFEATSIDLPAHDIVAGAAEVWTVRGRLTLAGTSRDITLSPRVSLLADGSLQLEAEVPVKMTDYGVKPPTFMGMVRTGNDVTVKIVWRLNRLPAGS
jgi:Uncharacterized conserved protein